MENSVWQFANVFAIYKKVALVKKIKINVNITMFSMLSRPIRFSNFAWMVSHCTDFERDFFRKKPCNQIPLFFVLFCFFNLIPTFTLFPLSALMQRGGIGLNPDFTSKQWFQNFKSTSVSDAEVCFQPVSCFQDRILRWGGGSSLWDDSCPTTWVLPLGEISL